VAALTEGAAELQELLISIDDSLSDHTTAATAAAAVAAAAAGGRLVVIEWVAPWASASLTLSQQLQALAAACPHLPVVSVDVSGSTANQVLAVEKVMQVPQPYRKGGRRFHPLPKSGEGAGSCYCCYCCCCCCSDLGQVVPCYRCRMTYCDVSTTAMRRHFIHCAPNLPSKPATASVM
jgi:hypothetical protein